MYLHIYYTYLYWCMFGSGSSMYMYHFSFPCRHASGTMVERALARGGVLGM